jgi:hypothetical protein
LAPAILVDGIPQVVRIAMLRYAWVAVMAVIGGAVYANRAVKN